MSDMLLVDLLTKIYTVTLISYTCFFGLVNIYVIFKSNWCDNTKFVEMSHFIFITLALWGLITGVFPL